MICPICGVEGEEYYTFEKDCYVYCPKCNLILEHDDNSVQPDLEKLNDSSKIVNYINQHKYNFSNGKLLTFSGKVNTNYASLIQFGLDNIDEDETVGCAIFTWCFEDYDDPQGFNSLLFFTNKRIICFGNKMLTFDYLETKIKFWIKDDQNYFKLGKYIFINCSADYPNKIEKDDSKYKAIFSNKQFDKTFRRILDAKHKDKREKINNEIKAKKEETRKKLEERAPDGIKDFIWKKILSDFEFTDENKIYELLKEKYDISYEDIKDEYVKDFYIKTITKFIEESKSIKQEIKNLAIKELKEGHDDLDVSNSLITNYNITSEAADLYIAKAINSIKSEEAKDDANQKRAYIKRLLEEYNFDSDKVIEKAKEDYQMSENRTKKFINEIKRTTMQNIDEISENILIENEGNIFKAIKQLMTSYNLDKNIAKQHIDKAYKSIMEGTKEKEEKKDELNNSSVSSTQFSSSLSSSTSKYSKLSEELLKPVEYHGPKCPTCGSGRVHKISGINRGVSIAMWGIMSSKIGKTMQCDNCGYKW